MFDTLYSLELFYSKIISISQKYLFWGYSKWQQIKQSAPGLNQGLSWKFFMDEKFGFFV